MKLLLLRVSMLNFTPDGESTPIQGTRVLAIDPHTNENLPDAKGHPFFEKFIKGLDLFHSVQAVPAYYDFVFEDKFSNKGAVVKTLTRLVYLGLPGEELLKQDGKQTAKF
jgi:hypothetical protein